MALIKRSFTIQGHRTSVALEAEFWAVFDRVVASDGVTPTAWVTALDEARASPLASAMRVELLHRVAAPVSDPAAVPIS